MVDDRAEVIQGLRDLADLLSKRPTIPTPIVRVTGSMVWGHSFGDVLAAAEALAPCRVVDSTIGPDKKVIEGHVGPVEVRVIVDATACGEFRVVDGEMTFFVDTEVLRTAAHPRPVPVAS